MSRLADELPVVVRVPKDPESIDIKMDQPRQSTFDEKFAFSWRTIDRLRSRAWGSIVCTGDTDHRTKPDLPRNTQIFISRRGQVQFFERVFRE